MGFLYCYKMGKKPKSIYDGFMLYFCTRNIL